MTTLALIDSIVNTDEDEHRLDAALACVFRREARRPAMTSSEVVQSLDAPQSDVGEIALRILSGHRPARLKVRDALRLLRATPRAVLRRPPVRRTPRAPRPRRVARRVRPVARAGPDDGPPAPSSSLSRAGGAL
jgi:hypothetical protein